jgi:hypothetical protein
MTTFTTEDRILAEKDGSFTINVEGSVTSSPPHIVDSGASVMIKDLTNEEIRALWKPMPDTKVYVSDLINFARAILKKARE